MPQIGMRFLLNDTPPPPPQPGDHRPAFVPSVLTPLTPGSSLKWVVQCLSLWDGCAGHAVPRSPAPTRVSETLFVARDAAPRGQATFCLRSHGHSWRLRALGSGGGFPCPAEGAGPGRGGQRTETGKGTAGPPRRVRSAAQGLARAHSPPHPPVLEQSLMLHEDRGLSGEPRAPSGPWFRRLLSSRACPCACAWPACPP